MADYNFSGIIPYTSQPARYDSGNLYAIDFEYTLTGVLAAADTITTPANALPDGGIRIVDVEVSHPELDTNVTPTATYNVGDSDSVDRFIQTAVMGVDGITTTNYLVYNRINRAQGTTNGVVSSGSGYLYAQDTSPQLILTIASAFATAAPTGVIRMRVWFYCTGEQ